jgi:hypothetical protein
MSWGGTPMACAMIRSAFGHGIWSTTLSELGPRLWAIPRLRKVHPALFSAALTSAGCQSLGSSGGLVGCVFMGEMINQIVRISQLYFSRSIVDRLVSYSRYVTNIRLGFQRGK